MQIFKKKFLFKLIVALCLIIVLLNITVKSRVNAGNDEYKGGVLIKPVVNLLTGLGDIIIEIMHKSIQSQGVSLIKITTDTTFLEKLGVVLIVAIGIALSVLFIYLTGGIGAGIISHLSGMLTQAAIVNIAIQTAEIAAVGSILGVTCAIGIARDTIPDDLYLPMFSISPEEIFSNEILLFDVNFFNPKESQPIKETVVEQEFAEKEVNMDVKIHYYYQKEGKGEFYSATLDANSKNYETGWGLNYDEESYFQLYEEIINGASSVFAGKWSVEELGDRLSKYNNNSTVGKNKINEIVDKTNEICKTKGITLIDKSSEQTNGYGTIEFKTFGDDGEKGVINIKITNGENEKKDKAKYADVTINIIGPVKEDVYIEKVTGTKYSTASQLQNIVSTWYFILRNIALLVLMLILIYTGIRIVIGSTAGEKAKYKERLMDWVVALCLVFIMHYIMVFTNEIVGKITDLVKNSTVNGNAAYIQLNDTQWEHAQNVLAGFDEKIVVFDEVNKAISWTTDLAGVYRIQSQLTEEGTSAWIGYSLCYCVLVLFTLFFAFTYAKRVVYMAFLTIIAPLVAMTYPLDKMTDGKAQAFDSWLKEYIFNLMIQPLHLLLYTILVSSAFALASESPIYALVAVGFMIPAEKLLRRFFGFEKAKTPGLLGGAAGAAFMMSGLQKLTGHRHPKGNGGPGGKDKDDNDSGDIRLTSDEGIDPFKVKMNASPVKSDEVGNKSKIGEVYTYKGDDGTTYEQMGSFGPQTQPLASNLPSSAVTPMTSSSSGGATPTLIDSKGATSNNKIKLGDRILDSSLGKALNLRVGGRIVKSATSAYGRGMKKKFVRSLEKGRPVRALARTATGVAGAAFGLGAATVAATVSGDPNNILKYGSLAATGGYSAGANLSDSVQDFFSAPNEREIATEMEREAYGKDYARHLLEQDEENKLMTESNISRVRTLTNWSRGEAEEFLQTHGRNCYRSGVKDVDDMLAIQRAVEGAAEDKKIDSEEEAIAAMKLKNSTVKNMKSMTTDKIDKWKKTIASSYESQLRQEHKNQEGWDDEKFEEESQRFAQRYIDDFRKLDSALSSIKKVKQGE